MRARWRRRLVRCGRVVALYVSGVALTVLVAAAPWRHVRPPIPSSSVMVSTTPRPQAPAASGDSRGTSLAGSWATALIRSLCRMSLRTSLPWPAVLDEQEEDRPLEGGIRGALLRLLGIGEASPGSLLATGIPAIRHLNVDVYASRAQARRSSAAGVRSPEDPAYEPVITHMPPSGAMPGLPESPLVAIYHTHSRESYLPELPEANVLRPDDAHTDDLSVSVVRVGKEIAATLDAMYGIGAVHSTEMHDREGKLGAYVKSEQTVTQVLKEYPSVQLMLDVHRDSQPRERTTIEVNGRRMARVMIVVGTDNPHWKTNQAVGSDMLKTLETRYPGISLGVYPKPGQFNQQHSPGGLVLEIGGVENTLDECLATARAVAWAVYEMVRTGRIQV